MNRINSFAAATVLMLASTVSLRAVDSAADIKGSFLLDPHPVGKTPKYLGVCLEVA